MDSSERRRNILKILKSRDEPIKGTALAEMFGISRQVIVQDIAILRASGENILATPKGYIIPEVQAPSALIKTLVCKHHTYEEIEDELVTIVDLGGRVIDVVVDHPIYGEKRGMLMIASRQDVRDFMKALKEDGIKPLSSLTGGVHLHNIEVKDQECFKRIKEALEAKGYLIKA